MRRAVELCRADYVHALGSLATLVIVFVLVRVASYPAPRAGDNGDPRGRLRLADLVVSPLLFLGGALLYFDQAARVRSSPATEEEPMPTYLMLRR